MSQDLKTNSSAVIPRKKPVKFLPDAPLKLVIVSFLTAFSSVFQYGYATTYINTAQISFMNYLNASVIQNYQNYWTENDFAWIWAVIVNADQLGFMIGILLIPLLAETYGRKWCLLVSIIPEAIGTILCVVGIPLLRPTLLAIGRFVMGIGTGVGCIASTLFLQECSPTPIRGFISSFQEFAACVTCVLGMVLGLPACLGSVDTLSYLIGFGLFGAFIRLILIFCPDTPKYLLLRKKSPEKALLAVEFYHGRNADVKSAFRELEKEGELESEADRKLGDNKKPNKLMALWREKHVRKAVIIGCMVFLAVEATGIVPIYEYSTFIETDSGLSQKMAEFGTLLMAVCNTVSTFLSILIVEKYGRRKLLLFGLTGIVVCLISLTTFNGLYQWLGVPWAGYGSMVSLIAHAVIFSVGPGPISWFVTSELVPQHVRSTAQAFTQMINIVANLCISFVFFPLYTAIGPPTFIILCIVPTILFTIYLYLRLPETKNREITDIVFELMGKNQKISNDNVDDLIIEMQKF